MPTIPLTSLATSWKTLHAAPAAAEAWLALADAYQRRKLPWQAAFAARQGVRCDASLRPRLDALQIEWPTENAGDALLGRPALPEAAALADRFATHVEEVPDDWLTWLYLARLYEMPGPSVNAEACADARNQAVAREILPGETLHWLGVWRLNAGDAPGATEALSGLLAIDPPRYGSLMYLGEALLQSGNPAAAEKAFARASLSANPDFLLTLAARVYRHNYWQEALNVLRKAAVLRPDDVPTWLALARMQSEVYALADCRDSLRQLARLAPDNAEAALIEAGLQGRMGDARGHLATLQRAYESGGDPLSRLASSVAMTSLYHDTLSPSEVADLHRRLCAPIEAAVTAKTEFANDRSPTRRLRIGYVSGDFHRQHPVNLFMLPVLLRHDHARFEICIYHTGSMHDEYTRQAKGCADLWREVHAVDDGALQQMIVADRIDLLIDLAGHTSTHRLGVFALRAAPVQATFLGYPHSTGLSAIDWVVGDATVTPAAHADLFSEGLAQLPGSVFCWAPVDDYPLPPPRPADAPLVFGSFNNAMKLSPRTIELWARVLHAVPDARLLLKAPSLKDTAVRARFTGLFAAHGIAAERLEFRGPCGLADMMQEYGEIDIGLDPTPYNGGTTTLQALWMGVPVVSLNGGNFVSRMGASFLTTLGHHEWIAGTADDYVAIASRLTGDRQALRAGRDRLRNEMSASSLCDIDTYTGHLEALYISMWANFCEAETQRVIRLQSAPKNAANPTAGQIESHARKSMTTAPNPQVSPTDSPLTTTPALEITTSRQMLSWLAEQKLSIALTTYQIGKLFFLGLKDNDELSVFERSFNRCMGLCPTVNGLYMSSLYQVWRFENLFTDGQTQDGYDRLYLPQVGHTTGDLDIHDMAVDADGRLVFVNTLFGCLATLSDTHSFKPLWRPPFLSKLAAEDRCHLNGLAMKDGRPAYVTAVGQSDVVDGWRDHRANGGVVIDVATDEIVVGGLSMPHSPRWHNGRLWLLNSGTGDFGYVDVEAGRFVPVAFCAGYMRGLSFHGDYALVGLSRPRHNKTFSGLALDDNLKSRGAEPRCGIQVIDLKTGDIVHWVRFEGVVEELYDVVALPGARRPMALGFKTDEIRRVLSIEE